MELTGKDADEFYGKTAQDWLDRWDKGETVWTVEMGGLGPGYEQVIHMTAAEMIRVMLAKGYKPEDFSNKEKWPSMRKEIDTEVEKLPSMDLGHSGAQWVAALNIAANIYRRGPSACFQDEVVKDRLIQVCKVFP